MRPRVLPIIIVGCVLLAVDGALWYFAVTAGPKDRGALIGAASAWGVVVVGILVSWIRTLLSEIENSKAERRAAYTRLLSSLDNFIIAQTRFNNANAADKAARANLDRLKVSSSQINSNAIAMAEAQWDTAAGSLTSATAEAKTRLAEFKESAADASPLAAQSVQQAIAALNNTLDQDASAKDSARSNFVKAARRDLGVPSRADESTL